MKRTFKRYSVLLLAVVMALSFAGCMGNFYENAGEVNGVEISSGLYMMAQYEAFVEAQNMREDEEKGVFDQPVEGESANDWIRARAEELLRRYVCVREQCREHEIVITMDSPAAQNINQMMEYWPYMEEIYAERGISQETAHRYYTMEELSNLLFEYLYAPDGPMAAPDEELAAEYEEKYAYLKAISIPLNSSAEGVDVRDEVIEMTEALVEDLRGGKTMEEVAGAGVAEIFRLLERDYDVATAADNIYNSYVQYDQPESTVYTPDALDRMKNTAMNDYGILVTESTVVLYQKQPMFTEEGEFEAKRTEIVNALMRDDYDAYLESIYSGYEVDWAFGAQWYLSPDKVAED